LARLRSTTRAAPTSRPWCCTGAARRQQCPAGTFGLPATQLTTAACSGLCAAGYYCPDGSTTAAQQFCGGADVYCPTGSPAPVAVDAGYYSTPLALPAIARALSPQ
jgi:hypothetical protein